MGLLQQVETIRGSFDPLVYELLVCIAPFLSGERRGRAEIPEHFRTAVGEVCEPAKAHTLASDLLKVAYTLSAEAGVGEELAHQVLDLLKLLVPYLELPAEAFTLEALKSLRNDASNSEASSRPRYAAASKRPRARTRPRGKRSLSTRK